MKSLIISIGFMLAFTLLGAGCASSGVKEAGNSNLTVGQVKMEIEKGITTQEEILRVFGAPNIVTKNRSNNEVWNYNRMSYETSHGSEGGGLIVWGGSRAVSSSTTKSFDLIIIFDENDVVKDYSVISAVF
jgi:hypothetical protein